MKTHPLMPCPAHAGAVSRHRHVLAGGLALLGALFTPPAIAQIDAGDDTQLQETVILSTPTRESRTRGVLRRLEHARDDISRGVGTISRATDHWLASNPDSDSKLADEDRNDSYIRLRMREDFYKRGNHDSEYSLRGHLDLPQTSKRWRLFFDSDSSDLNTLADKKLSHQNTGENISGFSRDNKTRWFTVRNDVGIAGHLPLDPFYRFRFQTGKVLDDVWRADFEQRVWYYESKKWGEKSRLSFSRPLDTDYRLQITTDVQFQDRYDKFEYGEYFAILHPIGALESIRYEFGVLAQSQPTRDITSYYLQTVYSRSLHEDWVIFSVTPQMAFPRADDWKPNPGLFLSLDIYFKAM